MLMLPVLQGCNTIGLGQGRNTLVDADNWLRLLMERWCTSRQVGGRAYAMRFAGREGGKPVLIGMHRDVARTPDDMITDHANGDTLDNRRANLRHATASTNAANKPKTIHPTSSRYKGVRWHHGGRKWLASIQHNRRKIHLGLFTSEAEAAVAYNRAAVEAFGEFARLNAVESG